MGCRGGRGGDDGFIQERRGVGGWGCWGYCIVLYCMVYCIVLCKVLCIVVVVVVVTVPVAVAVVAISIIQ